MPNPIQRLRIEEHSARTVRLAPEAVAHLAREARDVVSVEFADPERVRLRTRQHVGVLFGPGIELRIEPKCSVGALFHLLSESYRLARLRPELVGYDESPNLFEYFVELLLRQAEALLRSGIRRDYRVRKDDLRVVRGRIDARRAAMTLLSLGRSRASRANSRSSPRMCSKTASSATRWSESAGCR